MKEDRRKSVRVQCNAGLVILRFGGSAPVTCRMLNLSEGGCRLGIEAKDAGIWSKINKPNMFLELLLSSPPHLDRFVVSADIRNVRPVEHQGIELGLQFRTMEPKRCGLIRMALLKLATERLRNGPGDATPIPGASIQAAQAAQAALGSESSAPPQTSSPALRSVSSAAIPAVRNPAAGAGSAMLPPARNSTGGTPGSAVIPAAKNAAAGTPGSAVIPAARNPAAGGSGSAMTPAAKNPAIGSAMIPPVRNPAGSGSAMIPPVKNPASASSAAIPPVRNPAPGATGSSLIPAIRNAAASGTTGSAMIPPVKNPASGSSLLPAARNSAAAGTSGSALIPPVKNPAAIPSKGSGPVTPRSSEGLPGSIASASSASIPASRPSAFFQAFKPPVPPPVSISAPGSAHVSSPSSAAVPVPAAELSAGSGSKRMRPVAVSRDAALGSSTQNYWQDPFQGKRIGEVLVRMGKLSQTQVDEAVEESRLSRERFGQYLVKRGVVTAAELCRALALASGMPTTDLNEANIRRTFREIFPIEIMKRYEFIPFDANDKVVCIATGSPFPEPILKEIKELTKKRVEVFLADEDMVLHLLNKTPEDVASEVGTLKNRRFPRYNMPLPASYYFCTSSGERLEEKTYAGQTVNIGEGGFRIEGPHTEFGRVSDLQAYGLYVQITIKFPPHEFSALCRPAFIMEKEVVEVVTYPLELGLSIMDMSVSSRQQMNEMLEIIKKLTKPTSV